MILCPVPGCGASRKTEDYLMCLECWRHVPKTLQRNVHRTWRAFIRATTDFPVPRRTRLAVYEEARAAAIKAAEEGR